MPQYLKCPNTYNAPSFMSPKLIEPQMKKTKRRLVFFCIILR